MEKLILICFIHTDSQLVDGHDATPIEDRGPIISYRCQTNQDCQDPSKCRCTTACICQNTLCVCSSKFSDENSGQY